MTSTELLMLKSLIDDASEMRNAFWFRSPSSAGARRSYEKRHTHELIEWDEGGHHYTAAFTTTCSCNNVYASGVYTKDGKNTTLLAIKNSYARMKNGVIHD